MPWMNGAGPWWMGGYAGPGYGGFGRGFRKGFGRGFGRGFRGAWGAGRGMGRWWWFYNFWNLPEQSYTSASTTQTTTNFPTPPFWGWRGAGWRPWGRGWCWWYWWNANTSVEPATTANTAN